MYQIEFTINGQEIEGDFQKPLQMASDTINFVDCLFVFEGEEWDGLDYIKAVFESTGHFRQIKDQPVDDTGHCIIPWENMTDQGMVRVNLVGGMFIRDESGAIVMVDDKPLINTRITTFKVDCVNIKQKVNPDSYTGKLPTPTAFEQLIAKALEGMNKVIARNFDSAAEYVIGNFVLYKGQVYKCIEPTSGEFDPIKWEEVILSDELEKKVDKEEGKGLSSNDFTDELLENLEGNTVARHIHENKEFLDSINEDSKFTPAAHTHQKADITDFPINLSDFNNDTHFISTITKNDIINALNYIPYNSSNPNNYINSTYVDQGDAQLEGFIDELTQGLQAEVTNRVNSYTHLEERINQTNTELSIEITNRRNGDNLRELLANKTTAISKNPNNTKYPTEKAVKDYIDSNNTVWEDILEELEARIKVLEEHLI